MRIEDDISYLIRQWNKEDIIHAPIADMEFIRRSQERKDQLFEFAEAWKKYEGDQTVEQFYDNWLNNLDALDRFGGLVISDI